MAGAIDVAVVALGTFVVALMLAERFRFVGQVDGRGVFSEADQARINQIDDGFNRAIRLGDSVLTLSGSGWWLTMLTLVGLTAVMFLIAPSRLERRTPGRVLLGLPKPVPSVPPGEPLEILAEVDPLPAADGDDERLSDDEVRQVPDHPDADADAVAAEPAPADRRTPVVPSAAVEEHPATDPPTGEPAQPPTIEPVDTANTAETIDRAETAAPVGYADPADRAALGRTVETAEAVDRGEPEPVGAPTLRTTLGDSHEYLAWDRHEGVRSTPVVNAKPTGTPRFDALALPESSLADNPIHASAATSTEPERANDQRKGGQAPIWSDEWNAWVYRDPKSGRWFGHDAAVDRWQPIG